MKKLWYALGRLSFWIALPVLKVYLGRSRRTRALIVNGGYVLVTKSWLGDGRWSLPGGGLHRDEEPLAGLCREVREEVGFAPDPTDFRSLGQYVFRNHGISFPYELFGTEAASRFGLRRQRLEIVETRWIKASELTAANAAPDVLGALQGAWPGQGRFATMRAQL